MEGASLYILRCADGKLYTGLTRRGVDERVSEHQQGMSAFTKRRRPVTLIFCEQYLAITDAIDAERRIKGWTRAKKLAYVAGDFERLSVLARRGGATWSGGAPDPLMVRSGEAASPTRAPGGDIAGPPRGSRRTYGPPHHEATGASSRTFQR